LIILPLNLNKHILLSCPQTTYLGLSFSFVMAFSMAYRAYCLSLCLVILIFKACHTSAAAVTIECQDLHNTLTSVWNMETGSQSSENITCTNALIRAFLTHMLPDQELEMGEITTEENSITINESSLTAESLKMWLVYAFLGKQFVAVEAGNEARYFEYSETTGQIGRNMLKCEFQQTLYLTLIITLILLLISILLWDALQVNKKKDNTSFGEPMPQEFGVKIISEPSTHALKLRLPHTFSGI